MDRQIEVVTSESHQQVESSVNNRIEEYEEDGFRLVDQELDVGGGSVTVLLVFEADE